MVGRGVIVVKLPEDIPSSFDVIVYLGRYLLLLEKRSWLLSPDSYILSVLKIIGRVVADVLISRPDEFRCVIWVCGRGKKLILLLLFNYAVPGF